MTIQDHKPAAAERRYGTFSYLPEMDAPRLRKLVEYVVARGWSPAVEHVEPERAADDYWHMWKLPLFGEKNVQHVLDEIEACRRDYPQHLIRLMGYDNVTQSQGACAVVHRPKG